MNQITIIAVGTIATATTVLEAIEKSNVFLRYVFDWIRLVNPANFAAVTAPMAAESWGRNMTIVTAKEYTPV